MLESSIWDGVEQLLSGIQRSSAPRRLLMSSINGEIIHSSPLLGGSIMEECTALQLHVTQFPSATVTTDTHAKVPSTSTVLITLCIIWCGGFTSVVAMFE